MPTGRLYQQFQRLAQLLGSDEREISLAEVADLLCCTPRNARLLLRRMQDQGWLSWSAEAGRGRRSRLTLLDSQESLTRRRLRELLSQGQLAQAVRLAEDRLESAHPAADRTARSGHPRGAPRSCGCLLPAAAAVAAHRPDAPLRNSPEPPNLQRPHPAK